LGDFLFAVETQAVVHIFFTIPFFLQTDIELLRHAFPSFTNLLGWYLKFLHAQGFFLFIFILLFYCTQKVSLISSCLIHIIFLLLLNFNRGVMGFFFSF